jgi:hypothetical protein
MEQWVVHIATALIHIPRIGSVERLIVVQGTVAQPPQMGNDAERRDGEIG